jgi:hypothetical protein
MIYESVIYEIKDLKALGINGGIVEKKRWGLASYKGGSEAGVLNYTLVLKRKNDDEIYAISATINNDEEEVDKKKFSELFSRITELIHRSKI